ncbi:hypothetical protein ACIQ6R_01480 [Streptomyces sp. NPDC096048]|uniref:hypothetical protein n=1 Tax=Streptomyces sp. NPDC096048 TaxID=3366072 RepID=UPI00382E33D3
MTSVARGRRDGGAGARTYGGAVDRKLYHETRSTGTALAAAAVCVVVTGAVHGIPPLPGWDTRRFLWALLGFLALWAVGELFLKVRRFRGAAPLADDVEPPPGVPLRRRLFLPGLFPVLALSSLVPALVWEPWFAVLPLAWVVDWGLRAVVIAVWERRTGLLLWRTSTTGNVGLATSPVSERPPTRNATGGPPA